jgi:hypothetical protein
MKMMASSEAIAVKLQKTCIVSIVAAFDYEEMNRVG